MKVFVTGEPFRKGDRVRVRDATPAASIVSDFAPTGVVEGVSEDGTRLDVRLDDGAFCSWTPAAEWKLQEPQTA